MILREATILYSGNDPDILKPYSNKRICCSCDICGRVRWVVFRDANRLCYLCSNKGENNYLFNKHGKECPNYGSKRSDKQKKIMSKSAKNRKNSNLGKRGKDTPNWKGGVSGIRDHVLHERDCIKLNKRFEDCEMHHITKSIVIYIPKELHNHIYHNLKNGQGMGSINMLALQFINGGL